MIRTALCIGLLAFAALGAQTASADERTPDQTTVSLKSAELSNGKAARFAYARLAAAARRVCDSDASDPLTIAADRACERQAVSDAIASLGAPQLSALAMTTGKAADSRMTIVAQASSAR